LSEPSKEHIKTQKLVEKVLGECGHHAILIKLFVEVRNPYLGMYPCQIEGDSIKG
jgi:hypothetical protein